MSKFDGSKVNRHKADEVGQTTQPIKFSWMPFHGLPDLIRKVDAMKESAKDNNTVLREVLKANDIKFTVLDEYGVAVEMSDIEAAGLDPQELFAPTAKYKERMTQDFGIISHDMMERMRINAWKYEQHMAGDTECTNYVDNNGVCANCRKTEALHIKK